MPETTKPVNWRDLLSRTAELGLGAVSLTKESVQKLGKELTEKGHLSKGEAKEALQHLSEAGKKQKAHLEELVEKMVDRALVKANLARRSELKTLEQRLAKLERAQRNREKG